MLSCKILFSQEEWRYRALEELFNNYVKEVQKMGNTDNKIVLTKGQKALFYGGATIAVLAVVSPVLIMALRGMLSLMGLVVCVLVLFGAWSLRHWAMLKWKNVILKMLKAEARKNPVESLQNEYATFKAGISEAGKRVQPLISLRNALKEKLDEYERKYHAPEAQLTAMLNKLSDVIDKVQAKLNATAAKLPIFKRFVEQQTDRYEIALKTGALAQALRQVTGDEDPFRDFIHNEAVDAIRTEYHDAMADIDSLLSDTVITQLIEHDDVDTSGIANFAPIDIEEVVYQKK